MTDIAASVKSLLATDSAVSAIVSTRIYPVQLPLGATLPAITYQEISGGKDSVTDHGYPRYQVSCWTGSFAQSRTLKAAVIDCLNRYKGINSGNHIKRITYLNSVDLFERETGIYHIPIDFKIIHFN